MNKENIKPQNKKSKYIDSIIYLHMSDQEKSFYELYTLNNFMTIYKLKEVEPKEVETVEDNNVQDGKFEALLRRHGIFEYDVRMNAVIDELRAQWQSQHSYTEDKWISVEDRLPEKSGLVEICLADSQDIYIAFYKKDRKLFQVWGAGRDPIIDMKTTHWKPIPKPPMHICRELDCNNKATKEEYPDNSYFVCDTCYEKLHPNK